MDAPETDDTNKLYALFDGDEIDGKFYTLGESIDLEKHDAGTLAYLKGIGRIGSGPPTAQSMPIDTALPLETMTRAQLLAEAGVGMEDAELREMVGRRRESENLRTEIDQGDPLLDQSVEKLSAALADIDDLERLRRMRVAEVHGKSRGTALAAIDARIDAVVNANPDYDRDDLANLDPTHATTAQLRVMREREVSDVAEGSDDDAIREALKAKRGGPAG